MKNNKLIAVVCSLGIILDALSFLIRASFVSNLLLLIGCGLLSFGFVKYTKKSKQKTE